MTHKTEVVEAMKKKDSQIAKGIAICMMLIYHLFSSEGVVQRHGGENLSFFPFANMQSAVVATSSLKVCVAVFVFVTAYGTYVQCSQREIDGPAEITTYALRHIIKLLFGFQMVYFLCLFGGLMFESHNAFTVYGPGLIQNLWQASLDCLGLAAIFMTPTLNPTWWYMSLALLLICLLPLYRKAVNTVGGYPLLLLSFLLPLCLGNTMKGTLTWYVPTIALSTCCAQYSLFERWDNLCEGGSTARRLVLLASPVPLLCMVLYARQVVQAHFWAFDASAALLVCIIARDLRKLRGASTVLETLGVYSMNMFLMHTFLFEYYFDNFYYSMGWFALSACALIASSLALSCGIELLKQKLGIMQLAERLSDSIIKAALRS